MNAPASITITPILVADLSVEGEVMPVYVHVIDHPDARILVDTGMTELHPAVVAALDPTLYPLNKQDFDLAGVDIVVNTHLHADHCGGNHLFAGKPIYVQRRELDDAHSDEDEYPIREWVDAPGARYVPVDGEFELLPGLRLVPAPGHTAGMQVVVVETGGRPVVVGGDVAVWFGELDEPNSEGQFRVLALDPELVWLAHEHEPWRPRPGRASWEEIERMAKLVFGMNQSLDGYVDHMAFGPSPTLFRHFIEEAERQAGSVYGRKMYEIMRYWDDDHPDWEPDGAAFAAAWRKQPKWVVSRTLKEVGPNATLVEGDLEGAIRALKAERDGEIEVAGPELAQSLTELGLIDEYRIYLHPAVLGHGKPYFAGPRPPLRLMTHDRIGEDVIRLTYVPA